MSLRQVWYSFIGAVVLAATIGGGIWFYIHQNDADIRVVAIHVLSDLVPFLAALAIALWAERVTKFSHTTRVVILLGGLAWSGVWGWRDLTDIKASKADIKGAITTAVTGANTHTDQQIAGVKKDVDDVGDKVAQIQSNLKQGFSGLKPPPPKFAAIKFGFLDPFMAAEGSLREGPDGVFSAELLAQNVTDVAAEKGDVWIQICDECLWVDEPIGFDRPSGTIESMRHESFQNLNSGTMLPKIALHFKALKKFQKITLVAKYSCSSCGKMANPQLLTIDVLPNIMFSVPPPKLN
jgi:hypothetical protein